MIYKKNSFTLIELLVVVAMIGLLVAIAIPKYGDLLEKANLGATMGNLTSIRSALSIYYSNNMGWPPTIDPASCIAFRENIGNTLPYVKAKRPYSNPPYGNGVTLGTAVPNTFGSGWYYNYTNGEVYINSIAIDIDGKSYTTY